MTHYAYPGVVEAVRDDGRLEVSYEDATYELRVWRTMDASAVERR